MKPISDARADRLKVYEKMKRKWLAGRKCQYPRCGSELCDLHHARGRVGPLLTDERWWRSLCRKHHDWVRDNTNKARALGLLCPYGLWNTPDRSEITHHENID